MTVTLTTNAARAAVKNHELSPTAAKKVEQLASTSASAAARGIEVDAFDAAKSFPKADKLEGAERALFHAAFKELAQQAGLGLAALAGAGARAPASGPPSLFTKPELAKWQASIQALVDAKSYDRAEAARAMFGAVRLKRAAEHPHAVADALLVLVGSRGARVPTLDDAFKDIGRGGALDSPYGAPSAANIDVGAELSKHDTPENRRLLHSILAGFLEMPTTVAGSGAVKYFLGTGSFAGKEKEGVGLLSAGNAWAKEATWKNSDTERVVTSLFAHHFSSGEWNGIGGLLTQPKGGFTGYPEPELWNAASASTSSSSPFAMTHSERNHALIGKLMEDLEGRGLGPELDVRAPKLSVKLKPSDAKKAMLAHAEAKWDAAILVHNRERPEFKVEGKAKDQPAYVWERATVTRGGVKEQVQRAGSGYGYFQAIIVTTPEGQVKEVHALDHAKLKARMVTMDELKDPNRPWLDRT